MDLNKELEMIVQTIETQYNKMKEEKKQDIEYLRQRTHQDEDVRSREMQLRMAQAKVNKMKKEIDWMKQQVNTLYLFPLFIMRYKGL